MYCGTCLLMGMYSLKGLDKPIRNYWNLLFSDMQFQNDIQQQYNNVSWNVSDMLVLEVWIGNVFPVSFQSGHMSVTVATAVHLHFAKPVHLWVIAFVAIGHHVRVVWAMVWYRIYCHYSDNKVVINQYLESPDYLSVQTLATSAWYLWQEGLS